MKAVNFIAFAVATALSGFASAQSTDETADSEWDFVFTPYLSLPVATTGTTTVSGFSADIGLDLNDILTNLNFAVSGRFEAWRGDFGAIADIYYVNIGGSATGTLPGPGALEARVDVTLRQGRAALFGAYRFADEAYTDDGLRYRLEAGAGAQFNLIDQDVDFTRLPSLGGEETWFEPVVMLRGRVDVTQELSFVTRGEFGGFGVGGDQLQWNVIAGLDYQAWENTSIGFGWIFYGIDFVTDRSNGKFRYDIFQTGPFVSASYRF